MPRQPKLPSSPRPAGDMFDRVRQQVRMLLDSADRYDRDDAHSHDEALNMAMRLRTLLHTTGVGKSALEKAGYIDTMRFTNSVGVPPQDGSLFIGALAQQIDLQPTDDRPHVRFKPTFAHHAKQRAPGQQVRDILSAPKFAEWWTAVMIRDFDGREFTRQSVVLAVANQDGGGHLDDDLPDDYLAVSRGPGTFGISISINNGDQHHAGDPIPALLRQITWEFQRSLVRTASELLPDTAS